MASVIIPKVGKYVGMVMYAICVILLFLMFGASFIGLRPGYTDLYKAANDIALNLLFKIVDVQSN
jgi:hypothetical protein